MSSAFIRMQNSELGISWHGTNLLKAYAYFVIVKCHMETQLLKRNNNVSSIRYYAMA